MTGSVERGVPVSLLIAEDEELQEDDACFEVELMFFRMVEWDQGAQISELMLIVMVEVDQGAQVHN